MITAYSVRDAFNYLFIEELNALRELVLELPREPVIINIGAGAGTSGLLFLQTRPDSRVYTIDIQDESSPLGCLEGERQVVEQAGLSYLKGSRWFQIHADSKSEEAWRAIDRNVDLLFVDGDHSYEGCLGDLERWTPAMWAQAYVAVHDYKKKEDFIARNPEQEVTDEIREKIIKPYPGVDKAVDAYLGASDRFEHVETTRSLTVYRQVFNV